MSARFIIYALVDPRDGAWRYIGLSKRGSVRPNSHKYEARGKRKSHKNNWIKGLQKLGLQYDIEILEEVSSANELKEVEREWIAEARRVGVPLTNVTDGGDSGSGYKPTAERLAMMSAAMKGRKFSESTRERMAKSAKERWAKKTPDEITRATARMHKTPFERSSDYRASQSVRSKKQWDTWRETGKALVINRGKGRRTWNSLTEEQRLIKMAKMRGARKIEQC